MHRVAKQRIVLLGNALCC